MTTIISRRHIFKFYLSIVLSSVFFIAMATALIFIYGESVDKGAIKPKDKLMPVFGICCYAFAVYSLYRYIKNAPKITLSTDFINFDNQTFSISDIDKVELTGKRPFKYAIDFPMEAATLTFKNGTVKYIFDDMYSNSWEIKSFLKQVVIDKNNVTQIDNLAIDKDAVENDYYDTFKGNQITSLRGISLWGFVGFIGYMVLNNKMPNTVGGVIFLLIISIIWFLAHSYLMHYFKVSDNFFVVKNHNFFWSKSVYKVSDIKEIVFETQGKMPNCLRVITKDFKNKLYPAGTLRDNTWFALRDKLETYKIIVRNECI